MNVRYRVELSQPERDELGALLSGGRHAVRKLKRAQILLAADAGAADEAIAATLGVSGSTIYRTKRRFVEANLEGALSEAPRPGAMRKLSGKQEALLAHAVVTGPHNTVQGFTDWRETIQSDRLIPVESWIKVGPQATLMDSVGAVLGIGVRRDHEKGGRPFHSWANQPIQGIVGPGRNIDFSLTDGATEGQSILALNGGVILRGEAGVETAIASGGFVFVGTDTAGEDDLWRFYNVTRGRDYIHLMFLRTLRFYLGRFNINGQTIEAIRNTMVSALRDLQAEGDILGYKVSFERDQNSPENLRMGKFTVNFAAEEAPVLRQLGVRSSRYRPALDTLLDNLIAQLDIAA